MSDRIYDRERGCGTNFREAVCIHTDKVYDSCRDKDCLENIRVYLTNSCQDIVDRAINVKCTKAEIIWVFSEVERSKYKKISIKCLNITIPLNLPYATFSK